MSAATTTNPITPVETTTVDTPLTSVGRRVRSGELGAWPVIIGLIVIWVVFQSLNDRFLTAQNLSNMALQILAPGVISIGIVLVLLLGEIDISVGSVAGVGAALLAVLAIRHGLPEWGALLLVLVAGALIGTLHGFFFAKLGVPAFVVTLAGNLGWLGLQLWLLSPQGTINLPYTGFLASLTHQNLESYAGWIVGAIVPILYALAVFVDTSRRRTAGLPTRALASSLFRIAGLAALVAAAVALLNAWQGVPVGLLILVGLVAATDLVLRRTRVGRKVFAVGGNVEAARRAGINEIGRAHV